MPDRHSRGGDRGSRRLCNADREMIYENIAKLFHFVLNVKAGPGPRNLKLVMSFYPRLNAVRVEVCLHVWVCV